MMKVYNLQVSDFELWLNVKIVEDVELYIDKVFEDGLDYIKFFYE